MITDQAEFRSLSVEEKRRLLSQLIRERGDTAPAPASLAQRRMWLTEQITPGTPIHTIFFGLRLLGSLDIRALSRAVSAVVERHAPLRTTFRLGDNDVVQVASPP